MNFWYRLWGYLLPFPMWFAEFFMRTVMHESGANEFFPSSLAATALGLVIPALSPKSKNRELSSLNEIETNKDEVIRLIAGPFLFLSTLGWLLTVYLSIGGTWPIHWPWARGDQKLWIAIFLYKAAVLLNEWKGSTKCN